MGLYRDMDSIALTSNFFAVSGRGTVVGLGSSFRYFRWGCLTIGELGVIRSPAWRMVGWNEAIQDRAWDGCSVVMNEKVGRFGQMHF